MFFTYLKSDAIIWNIFHNHTIKKSMWLLVLKVDLLNSVKLYCIPYNNNFVDAKQWQRIHRTDTIGNFDRESFEKESFLWAMCKLKIASIFQWISKPNEYDSHCTCTLFHKHYRRLRRLLALIWATLYFNVSLESKNNVYYNFYNSFFFTKQTWNLILLIMI